MVLELPPETWGARLHRAYKVGKEVYGYTYSEIADAISAIYPVSQQTLIRLERNNEAPRADRVMFLAWLYVTAMGFDPRDLKVVETAQLKLMDKEQLRAELDPQRWKRRIGPREARNRCSLPAIEVAQATARELLAATEAVDPQDFFKMGTNVPA